jgi:HAD superfamily hydrolase (TIGR01484 family)
VGLIETNLNTYNQKKYQDQTTKDIIAMVQRELMLGFLFDIDGCITPRESKEIHSGVDPVLFQWFEKIQRKNWPIAFVTGRAYPFVKKTAPKLMEYLCFFEYGATWIHNGKHFVKPSEKEWREKEIVKLREKIKEICLKEKVPLTTEELVMAPKDGGMWIEKKETMISVASNTLVEVSEVQRIVMKAVEELEIKKVRINKHHLGIDLIPEDRSKKEGAEEARKIMDPDKKVSKWFVFGDSDYDKEMVQAFNEEEVEFVLTEKASEDVLRKLKEVFS